MTSHAFAKRMSTSFSVVEMLLPRYVNSTHNFKGLSPRVMASFCLKTLELCYIGIYIEVKDPTACGRLCSSDYDWVVDLREELSHLSCLRLSVFAICHQLLAFLIC